MIASPIVTVTMQQGTEQHAVTVQTDNRNQVKYDLMRATKNWPGQKDAPSLWLTVLSWHALALAGHITDETFERFNDRCLEVYLSDESGRRLTADEVKEKAGIKANPTQPGAEPGI